VENCSSGTNVEDGPTVPWEPALLFNETHEMVVSIITLKNRSFAPRINAAH